MENEANWAQGPKWLKAETDGYVQTLKEVVRAK